ncbi:hypothetical protein AB0I39_28105 [Kitasatospora purpeofusca]|uniref:hypothetical protein n=1 Tax=Kitasatospora purpeofusca TaxID=67352 RepID=UPI0033F15D5D
MSMMFIAPLSEPATTLEELDEVLEGLFEAELAPYPARLIHQAARAGTLESAPQPAVGAEDLALRMIKRIHDGVSLLKDDGMDLRSVCSRCAHDYKACRGKPNFGDETIDTRHSPVNLIAQVLLKLAEVVRLLRASPTTHEAFLAALTARNAAIEGDDSTVDEFSRTWLGITRPEQWREAVQSALLGDWVDALGWGLANGPATLELLRQHARTEHRRLQPLWERKVCGRRLRLLDDPVADGLTLRDALADHRRPEDAVLAGELADSRLTSVLRSLKPDEAAVAAVWMQADRITWAEAAAATGVDNPADLGERVRRKLRRLGNLHTQRASAAVAR